VAIQQMPEDVVIHLKGEANFDEADALAGSLMAPATRREACVNLDLTELKSISCLAMRVLVDYRRGVVRTGGRVRLAGALQPAVHEAFARARLFELFDTTALGVAPGR
jgi:anti-anti-sigma factor